MNHKSFSQNPIFLKANDIAQLFIEAHPEAQRLRNIIQLKINILTLPSNVLQSYITLRAVTDTNRLIKVGRTGQSATRNLIKLLRALLAR